MGLLLNTPQFTYTALDRVLSRLADMRLLSAGDKLCTGQATKPGLCKAHCG